MFYDFNPRFKADHRDRRYLGEPGTCQISVGIDQEDPKYKGLCGHEY